MRRLVIAPPEGINWKELGSILEGARYHICYLGRSKSIDPDRWWECMFKSNANGKIIRGYGSSCEVAVEVALNKLAAHVFAS
jgi:hypothetical protein